MAIIATGQISIVDLTDGKSLSCYITSNLPKTQIKDPNPGGSINPDWSGTPKLILTPVIFANQTALALNATGLTITWKRKEGSGGEAALASGESVSGGVLTVSANKLNGVASGLLTYLCYVTYVDPDNGLTINVVADITFSQIQTALNAESVWIAGEQLFKYDASSAVTPSQIELTANVVIRSTAPASPVTDMLWLDTSSTPHQLKRWNGSAWVACGANVDLSAYYTKTEMDTKIEQTNSAIALKAGSSTVSSLGDRLSQAEQKITPEGIAASVTSAAYYAYEKYAGRNYCLNSGNVHTFVNNRYRYADGSTSSYTGWNLSVSNDLYAHSNNGARILISFDIKRTNVDASATSSGNIYGGIWVYYKYIGSDGSTVYTTGRGWYLRSTDSSFSATDDDWVRMKYGPLNLSSYSPIGLAYFSLGTSNANGTTGTVQYRNVKLEVLDTWTDWSVAPEDIYGLANRMATAESNITQNANNIAMRVTTSTYNTEKVYRGSSAPSTLYTNMLWLDTSVSPNLLKRYTGSAWGVAGAQEVKSSGIYIGPNNVAITTENFLLQLLDPSNNENVLMEMSANGNVGFKELYAENVVSNSVAAAYDGPETLFVNPSYSGSSDTYFRSLGEAVEAVNNRYLRSNVSIFLPSTCLAAKDVHSRFPSEEKEGE